MLISAGKKPDALAALPMPSGQNIPGHCGVRVPDVWSIVDVIDRCGDEICLGLL
jgi:hypothetical protein